MLYSPVGCHILNKTNYLVDIYNPAEVRDNGAPCLEDKHTHSPRREQPSGPRQPRQRKNAPLFPASFSLCLPVPASQARENTLA